MWIEIIIFIITTLTKLLKQHIFYTNVETIYFKRIFRIPYVVSILFTFSSQGITIREMDFICSKVFSLRKPFAFYISMDSKRKNVYAEKWIARRWRNVTTNRWMYLLCHICYCCQITLHEQYNSCPYVSSPVYNYPILLSASNIKFLSIKGVETCLSIHMSVTLWNDIAWLYDML